MLLDFKQFQTELEKITEIKPIPATEYVTGYIRAHFEQNLKQWMDVHYPQYTASQLTALANLSPLKRKERNELLVHIENLKKDSF